MMVANSTHFTGAFTAQLKTLTEPYRKSNLRKTVNGVFCGAVISGERVRFSIRIYTMNYPTVVNGIDFRNIVFMSGSEVITDSFCVARAFGKEPKNVIRDIERTIKSCPPEFDTELNFELCYKNNELQNGKPQKFYKLRKDGLMLLVMSYTKKEAMRIKVAYINAFNWMADVITKNIRTMEQERNEIMLEFMKEKDVASMSGRLLNRWGRVKKPQLLNKIAEIEEKGQLLLPSVE